MLKASNIDAINNQLEDLDCTERRITSVDLIDGSLTENYIAICACLIERLTSHDALTVTIPASNYGAISMKDLYDTLASRSPHFTMTSSLLPYRIVSFLCSNLQAERLLKLSTTGDSRRERAAERSKVLFQLDKICRDLQISSTELDRAANQHAEAEIVHMICTKITQCLEDIPLSLVHNPPRIISIPSSSFTEQQKILIGQIEEGLYQDFWLRRQMLLKRLDVTIKSFLWGEKAQGKEGEIVAAIQAQRANLSEEPIRYTLDDVLLAPVSLLHELAKRVTDTGGRRSLVKAVIIGAVPDRGGNVSFVFVIFDH